MSKEQRYAIVDIETTGGLVKRDKITEIAIVLHDGEKVIEQYQTLINPERSSPSFITGLTGITDEMVADAPLFCEVAKEIVLKTEGAVFVAHNARFDYGFLREEFARLQPVEIDSGGHSCSIPGDCMFPGPLAPVEQIRHGLPVQVEDLDLNFG